MEANKKRVSEPPADLLEPALILKGCRWFIHPMGMPGVKISHLIHWNGEDVVKSVCGKKSYHVSGRTQRGGFPLFTDNVTLEEQMSGTVIRYQRALDHMCDQCYHYLEGMDKGGLVVYDSPEHYHPLTRNGEHTPYTERKR